MPPGRLVAGWLASPAAMTSGVLQTDDRDAKGLGPPGQGVPARRGQRRLRREPGDPAVAVERVEVLGLPVVAIGLARGDREHFVAGLRPAQRAVGLVPVERVHVDGHGRAGPGAVVHPGRALVDARRGDRAPHPGERDDADCRGGRPGADPLAPHERRQQAEQQQPLDVGQLGPDERRGHDGQRDERQRGGSAAAIAQAPTPAGERQHGGRVEDEHRRAQEDDQAHVAVGAQVGDERVGQEVEPVVDPVNGARDAHVPEPVPAQARDREGEEDDHHRRHARRQPVAAGDEWHAPGKRHRQRQQADQPPARPGAHQGRPPHEAVPGQRGEGCQAHPRPFCPGGVRCGIGAGSVQAAGGGVEDRSPGAHCCRAPLTRPGPPGACAHTAARRRAGSPGRPRL